MTGAQQCGKEGHEHHKVHDCEARTRLEMPKDISKQTITSRRRMVSERGLVAKRVEKRASNAREDTGHV